MAKTEAKKKTISIRPLGDGVLVKRADAEATKTPGGIILPDSAQKEKSKVGVVVEVGPGKLNTDGKLVPVSAAIKPGAKVFFSAGWDNEVDMGEEEQEYFLVHESDIRAIIK